MAAARLMVLARISYTIRRSRGTHQRSFRDCQDPSRDHSRVVRDDKLVQTPSMTSITISADAINDEYKKLVLTLSVTSKTITADTVGPE